MDILTKASALFIALQLKTKIDFAVTLSVYLFIFTRVGRRACPK